MMGRPVILTLMKHEFGNYVTQKLVETSTKDMRKAIRKMLDSANMDLLRSNQYSKSASFPCVNVVCLGKHVLNLLDKHHEGGNHKYFPH